MASWHKKEFVKFGGHRFKCGVATTEILPHEVESRYKELLAYWDSHLGPMQLIDEFKHEGMMSYEESCMIVKLILTTTFETNNNLAGWERA